MHVLFVHQNFPAQFGPFASRLARRPGWRCTFATAKASGAIPGVEIIVHENKGGASERTHYCSRTFENAIWQTHAVHDALAARPDIQPDLIVGHSGFGSTLFLRELYPNARIVNLFEFFYRTTGADMDFRTDFPSKPLDKLRARARNATILLDLDNCDLGYSPTEWQRSLLPAEYHPKVRTVFDGIDTNLWKPMPGAPRRIGDRAVPADMKIVTYVARGFESMRGFDIFMRAANIICKRRSDVIFAVVGQDRVCYGGDEKHTGGRSFKDWVLSRDTYDLSRFVFTGLLPESALARLLAVSDLHIYLTVPFVLSWSMLNAMACGAVVLGSDTPPVREAIAPGRTGLLADFFSPEAFADAADRALDDIAGHRPLGEAARAHILERYSLDVCLPKFDALLNDAMARRPRTGDTP
ncbi:MAG: glycosyltransferase [Gemmataceae bacterium]|nr:glycosyltransferase [Gemmataceae bacterium]